MTNKEKKNLVELICEGNKENKEKIADKICELTDKKKLRWEQAINEDMLLEYHASLKGIKLAYKKIQKSTWAEFIDRREWRLNCLKNNKEILELFYTREDDYVEMLYSAGDPTLSRLFDLIKKQCPPKGYDGNKSVYNSF